MQVFVMLMNGGDTKKITNAPNGVEQFAWRPNGRDIAYVTSDDLSDQKEIEKHNSFSNWGSVLPYVFKGSSWVGDNMKDYVAQSPITYVSQIKTPTLILHDATDPIVPITESYQLYHALRDNGVPVKFVAYPVAGHHPDDPVSHRMSTAGGWIGLTST